MFLWARSCLSAHNIEVEAKRKVLALAKLKLKLKQPHIGEPCETPLKEKTVSHIFEYTSTSVYQGNAATTSISNKNESKRLIPKLIHQTWKESVTKEKYPNMSRFIKSWKHKGWDHWFYDDEAAEKFISKHFPPQVKEAYDALLPPAFKADLFRYCVLFIHGGVYADIDVLSTGDLDIAIDDNVGFFVPNDQFNACLWNGFIASAPGHPILADIIETIVNNVRERFTGKDILNSMCHEGEIIDMETVMNHQDLFTSGPCLLGAVVNKILGRAPQTAYHATGKIDAYYSNNAKIDSD